MFKRIKNYSEEKKSNKKLIVIIGMMMCVLLIFISAVAAFYSDYVTNGGNIVSGTLKLSGSYTFYLNGEATNLEDIKNLNPGDVIVVECDISNNGNKSAWIRDVIELVADETILPYITVYGGEFTQADVRGQADLTDYVLPITDGKAVTANKVIDGSGSYAETESGEDYYYLEASGYREYFTIYFDHLAGNETQGKTFTFCVTSQALQFRNNNLSEPDDTAWATVVAAV